MSKSQSRYPAKSVRCWKDKGAKKTSAVSTESKPTPSLSAAPPGTMLTDIYPDGMMVSMRGDEVVGIEPAPASRIEVEATTRPWETYADLIFSSEGRAVIAAICEPHGSKFCEYKKLEIGSPDFKEAMANAALIVKAVNSHQALVDALTPFAHCDKVGSLDKRTCAELEATAWKDEPHLQGFRCNGCKARAALKLAGE